MGVDPTYVFFVPVIELMLVKILYLYQIAMSNVCLDQMDNFADDEEWEMPSNLDYNQLTGLFGFQTENLPNMPKTWLG